jgi:hypothetical protein
MCSGWCYVAVKVGTIGIGLGRVPRVRIRGGVWCLVLGLVCALYRRPW